MDFQGLELNSREAARRPLPFDILKRATRCHAKKKTETQIKFHDSQANFSPGRDFFVRLIYIYIRAFKLL